MKMNIMQENQYMVNVDAIVNISNRMYKECTFKQYSMRLNPVFNKIVKNV